MQRLALVAYALIAVFGGGAIRAAEYSGVKRGAGEHESGFAHKKVKAQEDAGVASDAESKRNANALWPQLSVYGEFGVTVVIEKGLQVSAPEPMLHEVFAISTTPENELLMDCVLPISSDFWSKELLDDQEFLRKRHGDAVVDQLCSYGVGSGAPKEESRALWVLDRMIIGGHDIARHNATGLTQSGMSRCISLLQDYRVALVACASKPQSEVQNDGDMIFGSGMTLRALDAGLASAYCKAVKSEQMRVESGREADNDDRDLAHYVLAYEKSELPAMLKERAAGEYFKAILQKKEPKAVAE